MTDLTKLNLEEQAAIEDLRTRMEKVLSPEMYGDSLLFYRFLKARDFDVGKAETMLKKHLKWRKVFQVDSILEIMKPMEVFEKCYGAQFIGFDRDGDLITYSPTGNIDTRDIFNCMKVRDFEKHIIYTMEENISLLNEENKKNGRNRYQAIIIIDLDKLTFANATNRASVENFLRLSHLSQDNYPEILKAIFVINAPSYYVFIYSILKKIMSNAMVQKIHIFGQGALRALLFNSDNPFYLDGWQEELLKYIDASVLPAFLGGSRTDHDGNPLCLTFIHHGGKAPPKYHLTTDERWFKDMSIVKKVLVPSMSKKTIPVDVMQCGSWIHWEFHCKSQDIEFGLTFQDNGNEIEVLPVYRYSTSDGTETGSYKTVLVGKYQIIFGNTYSWLTSKEVHYIVNVVNPDS